jgi:hypothetical protein
MNRMILKSRVGTDGVLHVNIPIGTAEAGRQVQITIEPESVPSKSKQEYWDFLDSTAGAWQGDFERPDQGQFEERDPLS